MKKKFNFISIFLLLMTFVSAFVLGDSSKAKVAAIYSPRLGTATVYKSGENYVQITKEGAVTIQYEYGYSELMIVVQECKDLQQDKKACYSFSGGPVFIIHLSGDYNLNGSVKQKKVHLFNYFDYDKIVSIGIYTSFMSKPKSGGDSDASMYFPLFCNVDSGMDNCYRSDGISAKERLSNHRVEEFAKNTYGTSTPYTIEYPDKKRLIYTTFSQITDKAALKTKHESYLNQGSDILVKNDVETGDALIVKIDNSKVGGASENVEGLIYDTIIPTLITILFIAAGVTCAVQGYKIVKTSDDPQERQEKIRHLRNVLIGIAIALLLLFAIEPASTIVTDVLEERE